MVSDRFSAWINAYERAWRTAGTETLRSVFTADASYRAAPFDDPILGLDAIARFWEEEREGPNEVFTLSFEIVAAQGDTAVARLDVVYEASQRTYRDLWIIKLTNDERCSVFEEWPFHRGQARTAGAQHQAAGGLTPSGGRGLAAS